MDEERAGVWVVRSAFDWAALRAGQKVGKRVQMLAAWRVVPMASWRAENSVGN